jgi:signal transduction histidine kinase
LIEAQEKEYSCVAPELHDDICQWLAVLSKGQWQWRTRSTTKQQLEEIRQRCSEIAGDVQHPIRFTHRHSTTC